MPLTIRSTSFGQKKILSAFHLFTLYNSSTFKKIYLRREHILRLLVYKPFSTQLVYPVGWGCRIHRLFLCRGVSRLNECLGYDTKQSDGVIPALELLETRSTPSLPSLPGLFWPGVVASDRALSVGQIELNCVLMLNWFVWNRTVFDIETVLSLKWFVWYRIELLTFECV